MRASEEQVVDVTACVRITLKDLADRGIGWQEGSEQIAKEALISALYPFDDTHEITVELEPGDKVLVWRRKA